MKKNEFPSSLCFPCASKNKGRKPRVDGFHKGICEVCMTWTHIMERRNFGYPVVKSNWDDKKAITILEKVYGEYKAKGENFFANIVKRMITVITQEMEECKAALH